MIDDIRINKILELDLKQYLENHGAIFKKVNNNILSPCLFHHDKTPSLSIKNNNHFKCFGCGEYGNIIDACKLINNVNFPRAVEMLEEYSRTGFINNTPIKKFNKTVFKKENQESEQKKIKRLQALKLNASVIDPDVKQYLKDRNLLNIVESINNKNFHLKIKMNEFKGNKSILYMFNKHNFIIQKNIKLDENGKQRVFNVGGSHPVPLILYPGDNEILIVEGIEDALTILAMKKNVIVLNSVANTNKLITCLKTAINWANDKEFKLLLDNDKEGRKHQQILKDELLQLNLKVGISEFFKILEENNLKDINDYYKQFKKSN